MQIWRCRGAWRSGDNLGWLDPGTAKKRQSHVSSSLNITRMICEELLSSRYATNKSVRQNMRNLLSQAPKSQVCELEGVKQRIAGWFKVHSPRRAELRRER